MFHKRVQSLVWSEYVIIYFFVVVSFISGREDIYISENASILFDSQIYLRVQRVLYKEDRRSDVQVSICYLAAAASKVVDHLKSERADSIIYSTHHRESIRHAKTLSAEDTAAGHANSKKPHL